MGVPSYVEFSQQHSPCYFFVTVRKAKDLDCHRLPTSAFEEAAAAEPWTPGGRGLVADPEAPPTPENGESSIQRKPSVSLPYNDDVRLVALISLLETLISPQLPSLEKFLRCQKLDCFFYCRKRHNR